MIIILTVHVIKEPTISIQDYSRGQRLQTQPLIDEETTLTIDVAKAWQFAVDDIETKQAHINWQALATNAAMYALKDEFDRTILSRINAGVLTSMTFNGDASATDLGFATGEVTPLAVINRLGRLLDEQNVPADQRWLVAGPLFFEQLRSEDSKFVNADWVKTGVINNGKVVDSAAYGFNMYLSNNMPTPATAQGVVLAGHMSAMATANTLQKTEVRRSEEFFGDKIRGMHLYGSKILRTEALARSFYTID